MEKDKKVELNPGVYYWEQYKKRVMVLVEKKENKIIVYDSSGKEYSVSNCSSPFDDKIECECLTPVDEEQRKKILRHNLNELLMLNGVVPVKILQEKEKDLGLCRLI